MSKLLQLILDLSFALDAPFLKITVNAGLLKKGKLISQYEKKILQARKLALFRPLFCGPLWLLNLQFLKEAWVIFHSKITLYFT